MKKDSSQKDTEGKDLIKTTIDLKKNKNFNKPIHHNNSNKNGFKGHENNLNEFKTDVNKTQFQKQNFNKFRKFDKKKPFQKHKFGFGKHHYYDPNQKVIDDLSKKISDYHNKLLTNNPYRRELDKKKTSVEKSKTAVIKVIKRKKFKTSGRKGVKGRRKGRKKKLKGGRRRRVGSRGRKGIFYFKRPVPYRYKFRRKIKFFIRRAFKSVIQKILLNRDIIKLKRLKRMQELKRRRERIKSRRNKNKKNKGRWGKNHFKRSYNRKKQTKRWKWLEKNWARENKIVLIEKSKISPHRRKRRLLKVRVSNLFVYRNLKNNFFGSKLRKIYKNFFKFPFFDKALNTIVGKFYTVVTRKRSRLVKDFMGNRRFLSKRKRIVPCSKFRFKWSIRNRLITRQSDLFFYRHYFSKGFKFVYSSYFKKFMAAKLLFRNSEQIFSSTSERILLNKTREKFFNGDSEYGEINRRFFRFSV